jgi:sulfonate transport system ATP-binding protein
VFLVALAAVIPVYINTHAGIRGVDMKLVEAGQTFGLNRWGLVRKVILRGALPGFLVGLRFALVGCWAIIVVAEEINAQSGLGYLIMQAQTTNRTDIMCLGLAIYAVLGLIADGIVRLLERYLLTWRRGFTGGVTMTTTADLPPDPPPDLPPCVAVSATGVARSFDGRGVLRGLDLTIGPDEFVALLGRSGTGKSTLLRIFGGLDPDYEGDVFVPARRAVVFQEPRLIPWLRVLPNVSLGLRPAAVPGGRDGLRRQSVSALAEVGLAGHAGVWPVTLSGGEAQRVALARALVREPQLMLLDEPFGALDALTRTRMHALLQDLCARHRPAVLLVTHDVDEAILLADRALVLAGGKIALDVPVGLDRPRDPGQPGFLGLRSRLLRELGVADAGADPGADAGAEPGADAAAEPGADAAAEPGADAAADTPEGTSA